MGTKRKQKEREVSSKAGKSKYYGFKQIRYAKYFGRNGGIVHIT